MKSINKATKKFAEELKISDRMECMDESEAYITIKDHNKNFSEKATFRLVIPSKSDIGKVFKCILDQINQNNSRNTNFNQWKSSTSVIDWFKAIHNKPQYTFLVFNIESLYPSYL